MSEYINRKSPITIKHKPCGTEYTIPRAEFLLDKNSGGKCPNCSKYHK